MLLVLLIVLNPVGPAECVPNGMAQLVMQDYSGEPRRHPSAYLNQLPAAMRAAVRIVVLSRMGDQLHPIGEVPDPNALRQVHGHTGTISTIARRPGGIPSTTPRIRSSSSGCSTRYAVDNTSTAPSE